MDPKMLIILCPLIFLAGFVDSIAGGGGLISLTSYMALGMPPHLALGNNKFASTSGTTVAAIRYIRAGQVEMKLGTFAVIFSLVGSAVGAHVALQASDTFLRYLMVVLVPVIAAFTLLKKDFGVAKRRMADGPLTYFICCIACLLIGFYDGFFGPGTGVFLTFLFSALIGLDIVTSCGTTKIVNLASNVAALATFILNGNIDYLIAIPCAACQIAGSYLGAGMAIRKGVAIVKPIMLIVMALLLLKLIFSFLV
ncbi:MAG: TSUP family transporter [Spirochaetia bacterium]|jgi:uncharacterized membrane protein YfcA|nr:TSUP family transporter [Spirochaetia bacterium]